MPCPCFLDLELYVSRITYCTVATVVLVTHFGLRLPNLTFPERTAIHFPILFNCILFYFFRFAQDIPVIRISMDFIDSTQAQ